MITSDEILFFGLGIITGSLVADAWGGTEVEIDPDSANLCTAYVDVVEQLQGDFKRAGLEGSIKVYGPEGDELCTIEQEDSGVNVWLSAPSSTVSP